MNNKKITLDKNQFQDCLKLAEDRLDSAEILLKTGKYRDSISRSYYAFFDIVGALLATKGLIPKTHTGALRLFSLHFVKTEVFPKEYGRAMRELMEERQEADYEWKSKFDKEDAQEAINETKEFIKMVKNKIDQLF